MKFISQFVQVFKLEPIRLCEKTDLVENLHLHRLMGFFRLTAQPGDLTVMSLYVGERNPVHRTDELANSLTQLLEHTRDIGHALLHQVLAYPFNFRINSDSYEKIKFSSDSFT
jgi:hypothetical protein